jgi:hypothetical protein
VKSAKIVDLAAASPLFPLLSQQLKIEFMVQTEKRAKGAFQPGH